MTPRPNQPDNTAVKPQENLPKRAVNLARRVNQVADKNGIYRFQLVVFNGQWFLEVEPGNLEMLGAAGQD